MSSSDFRQITNGPGPGKAERLFRAAVSAFCSLPRPSKREIAQLEDLVLPLFDDVSAQSRRYVAAALSETEFAPINLVRRLCDQPVEIAAPLLIRSPVLADIDLIGLVTRHGIRHARAIGRRSNLNPAIANLVKALDRPATQRKSGEDPMNGSRFADHVALADPVDAAMKTPAGDTPAEAVRQRLRAMMLPSASSSNVPGVLPMDHIPRAEIFAKLRTTALSGNPAYFQTALADVLGIAFDEAGAITRSGHYAQLILALKALDLDAEEAFLLAAAVFPKLFGTPESVRLFIERYEVCHAEAARERLRGWRAATLSTALSQQRRDPEPAGSNTNRPAGSVATRTLRAS